MKPVRSSSLDVETENIILSNHKYKKLLAKERGSVPNIFGRKFLIERKTNALYHSQPSSPTTSPGSTRRNNFIKNPLKFVRKISTVLSESSNRNTTEDFENISDNSMARDSDVVANKENQENESKETFQEKLI